MGMGLSVHGHASQSPTLATATGLEQLPQELLVHILSFLSLSDIGNLCLTGSSRLGEQVTTWMLSRAFARKVEATLNNGPSFIAPTEEELVDNWLEATRQVCVLNNLFSLSVSQLFVCFYRPPSPLLLSLTLNNSIFLGRRPC